MNKLFLSLLLSLLPGMAIGEEETPPVKLRFPTGEAAWTVLVKSPEAPPAKSEEPKNERVVMARIDTVQGQKRRCDRWVWSNRDVTQTWFVDEYVITQDREHKSIYATARARARFQPEEIIFNAGFFHWTQRVDKPEPVSIEGTKCLAFRKSALKNQDDASEVDDAVAYADAETGLLVAYVQNRVTYRFTFQKMPMPSMPDDFSEALKRLQIANTPPTVLNHNY